MNGSNREVKDMIWIYELWVKFDWIYIKIKLFLL